MDRQAWWVVIGLLLALAGAQIPDLSGRWRLGLALILVLLAALAFLQSLKAGRRKLSQQRRAAACAAWSVVYKIAELQMNLYSHQVDPSPEVTAKYVADVETALARLDEVLSQVYPVVGDRYSSIAYSVRSVIRNTGDPDALAPSLYAPFQKLAYTADEDTRLSLRNELTGK